MVKLSVMREGDVYVYISIRGMHLLILCTLVYENNLDAACSRLDTTRSTHFAKTPPAKKRRICMLFTFDS